MTVTYKRLRIEHPEFGTSADIKESSTYITDSYGQSLAKLYGASRSNRDSIVNITANTGSTDLTGDTYDSAVRGRLVIGTTQTNASLMGTIGCVDVGASKNIQGNVFGVDAVLDFYGACTAGSGASFYAGAIRGTIWNEGTTTVGASGFLSGLDLCQNSGAPTLGSGAHNPAINVRCQSTYRWEYGIYMSGSVKYPFYATSVLTGTAALDSMKLDVTDTQTLASGYTHGFYINWTKTGAQTGGAVNPFSIDFAATTGACTEVALESHYITQTGNKLTGNVSVWQAYVEDVGTGAANVMLLDIGYVGIARGTSRDCYIRLKQHNTATGAKTLFFLEGTNNVLAAQLFTFCGSADCFSTTTLSGGIAGRLKVNYESTPGGSSTQYYIPLYTS